LAAPWAEAAFRFCRYRTSDLNMVLLFSSFKHLHERSAQAEHP